MWQYVAWNFAWKYLPKSGGPSANDGGPPPGPLVNSGRLNTLFGSRVAVMIWKRCFCVNLIDPHVSWSWMPEVKKGNTIKTFESQYFFQFFGE